MQRELKSFANHDAGCPIITTGAGHLKDDFELFISALRLGRPFYRANNRLFSLSANLNSVEQYESNIDAMRSDLES